MDPLNDAEQMKALILTSYEENTASSNQLDLFELQFTDEDRKKFGNLSVLEDLYMSLRSFPTAVLTHIDEKNLLEGNIDDDINYFSIDDEPTTPALSQNNNLYNQHHNGQNTPVRGTHRDKTKRNTHLSLNNGLNESNVNARKNYGSHKGSNFRKNNHYRSGSGSHDRTDSSSETNSTKGYEARPDKIHNQLAGMNNNTQSHDVTSPSVKRLSSCNESSNNSTFRQSAKMETRQTSNNTSVLPSSVHLNSPDSRPDESFIKINSPTRTNKVSNTPTLPDVQRVVNLSSEIISPNKTSLTKSNSNVKECYEVVFGDQNSDLYFVRKKSDQVLIDDIAFKLKQEILEPWSKDSNIKKVVVKMANTLYRGCFVPVERKSGTLCFKLVDLGWLVDISSAQEKCVFLLPDNSVAKIKPLSFSIKISNTDKNIERNTVATIEEKESVQNIKVVDIVKFHEGMVYPSEEQTTVQINGTINYKNSPISIEDNLELHKQIEVIYSRDDPNNLDFKWVYPISYEEFHGEIQSVLAEHNFQYLKAIPNVGDFCLRELPKGTWSRFKVIGNNPLKIFALDYGMLETFDSESINLKEFQTVPEKLTLVKPFAFKVRLRDACINLNDYDRLLITPVEYKDKAYTVLVEGNKKPGPEKVISRQSTVETNVLKPVEEVKLMSEVHNAAVINRNEKLELNKPISVVFTTDDTEDDRIKWFRKAVHNFDLDNHCNTIGRNSKAKFERTPQLGQFCLSLYEEIWCRAKVVKIEPLTVFYIDYGNSEVTLSDIKPLPEELSSEGPLALKIKFYYSSNNSNKYEFGDSISITPVQIVDDVHVVLLENEKEDMNIIMERVYASEVAKLDLNKPVAVTWIDVDGHNKKYVWVQLSDIYETAINFYSDVEEGSTQKLNKSPQLGDLCMKEFEGIWCGAKIISINPLYLFYFDYGNVEKVDDPDELRLLPEQIKRFDTPAGLRIQVQETPFSASFGDAFTFTPTQKENNVYIGVLTNVSQ